MCDLNALDTLFLLEPADMSGEGGAPLPGLFMLGCADRTGPRRSGVAGSWDGMSEEDFGLCMPASVQMEDPS